MLSQDTDIRFLKGVGEKRAEILKSKGIDTVGALLRFYPRAYADWSRHTPIEECPFFENVCIKARIVSPIREEKKRAGMVLYRFTAADGGGEMSVTLFNQKFLASRLNTGREYLFYGKLGGSYIMRQMNSPEIKETGYAAIHPIYPAFSTMSSKNIENITKAAISSCEIADPLPKALLERLSLCGIDFALKNIHFPSSKEALERAKKRLVFEELFMLQTALYMLKNRNRTVSGCKISRDYSSEFQKSLPFSLTGAQKRVISECIADMLSGRHMNRLVQGDVGSGKTAVAAALCYTAAKNGCQSAFMAPTEILACQHFASLSSLFKDSGIICELLTGSMTKKQKGGVKARLKNGEIDIIVGTHALLTEDVEFKNLGLAVTDEQHRFGVAQRGGLASKGVSPHTLVMSATPIPRTLGLIIYGDLDISIIDEYPAGRQYIDTYLVDSSYRGRVYNYIKKHLDGGRQAYIVCPLVEEGENTDLKSASEYYEELKVGEFKDYTVGLLHGKMKPRDKDSVMQSFKNGDIQLLISTTVIEVGIDVPNAVIMVIENAERFGLSQLHQLRGRIGRGKYKSSCILISDSRSADTQKRLKIIKSNNDGFKIADEDLRLRGPGDFLGNRQHGLPDLKIADLYTDFDTLRSSGKAAEWVLKNDPKLNAPENAALKSQILNIFKSLDL